MGPLIQNYTDLKYNILVAIAVSWSKRVDAIGRRRPVEHHWFIRGMSEIVLDLTPLRGGGGGGGGGGGQKVLLIIKWQPHPKYKANSARTSHIVVWEREFNH